MNIVYKGAVTNIPDDDDDNDDEEEDDGSDTRNYVGLTSTTWKERLGNHKQGFNNRSLANRCELSKYIWNLKDNSKAYAVKWEILEKVRGRLIAGACKLCTAEKLHIIDYPDRNTLLNSNSIQKCVHDRKHLLAFYSRPADTMD